MPPHLFILPQEVFVLIFRHFHPVDAIRTKRVSKRLHYAIWTWVPFGFYVNPVQNNSELVELQNTPAYEELCVCNITQINESLAKCPLDVDVCIEQLLTNCGASIAICKSGWAYSIVDHTSTTIPGIIPDESAYVELEIGLLDELTLSDYEIEIKYATCSLERRVEAVWHMLKTGRVSNSLAIQHALWTNDHLPASTITQCLEAFLRIPDVCVNATGSVSGCTALHCFCEDYDEDEEKLALARWLIDHGADPTLKTTDQRRLPWGTVPAGATAIDILCLKHPNLCGPTHDAVHPVAKRLYDMLAEAVASIV